MTGKVWDKNLCTDEELIRLNKYTTTPEHLEVRRYLESVPDAYYDFVIIEMCVSCEDGYNKELIEYIKQNPTATSGDIGNWLFDTGIHQKQEIIIVDDDEELDDEDE